MKFIFWLGKLTLAALLVSTLTVFVTWTAVQTYLDKVLDHYQLGQGMETIKFSDFMAEMTGSLNIMKQPVSKGGAGETAANNGQPANAKHPVEGTTGLPQSGHGATSDTKGSDGVSRIGEEGDGSEGTPSDRSEPSDTTNSGGSVPKGPDAVPVWGQTSAGGGSSTGGLLGDSADKQLVLSTEDFQKTKDNITNEDKMRLFSLLVSKLPSDELQKMSALVEDGITGEELAEMNRIVEQHLSPDEYKQVLAILEKY